MFKSLSSRLTLSFIAVIALVLVVVAVTLFFATTSQDERVGPTLQRLAAISQTNRDNLRRLQGENGTNATTIQERLTETAVANNIRIIILNRAGLVTFDTDPNDNWINSRINTGNNSLRKVGSCSNQGSEAFLYEAADSRRWILCAQQIGQQGQQGQGQGSPRGVGQIIYAQREPTRRAFFRDFYVTPLFRAGGAALLLAVILAIIVANSIAKPLKQLAEGATAVSEGKYDHQIPLAGPEEVQQVAANFNHMAQQVKNTQQAQRDFVANVSHDLKTPITSIRGWSGAMLDGTAVTTDAQNRAATIINNESQRMLRMVNQLLDLARIESGQFELSRENVDVHQVLTNVHHNLRLKAEEKEVHFTLDLWQAPPVWGDYDRLMQLFTNLVDNGIAHTEAGGRVHLGLQRQGDEAVEITVQDTGSGIPAEQLERIFERFYQVDASRARKEDKRGTGLGLAIVKELVEAHNGRIEARSQVGEGTAFVVHLPTTHLPVNETQQTQ